MRRSFISLDDVELMPRDQSLRLRVPGARVASLHPADLAEIISDLNRAGSDQLLKPWTSSTWRIPWKRWSRNSRPAWSGNVG